MNKINMIPRRCQLELMNPVELRIQETILAVENMGADARLTDAVVLLGQAKDKISDFIDGTK